jgi:hypothetical protein
MGGTRISITAKPASDAITKIRIKVHQYRRKVDQGAIPDAWVEVTRLRDGFVVKQDFTDNTGILTYRLPPDDYWVAVTKEHYGPVPAAGQKPTTALVQLPHQYCGAVSKLSKNPDTNEAEVPFNVRMATDLKTSNPFLEFGDRQDWDFGELLFDLLDFPVDSHAHQAAHFTHTELKMGNIIAVVGAAEAPKVMKNQLPATEYNDLMTSVLDKTTGDIVRANGIFIMLDKDPRQRGYVIISKAKTRLASEWEWSPDRIGLARTFAHEMNHHRNRVLSANLQVFDPAHYVDPKAARDYHGHKSRAHFIKELAARRLGWLVEQELNGKIPPPNLAPGALWNAVLGLADWYVAYQDEGYMKGLNPPDKYKQAWMWLVTCADTLIYHNDAGINQTIQASMKSEANLGAANGYARISPVKPDGITL